MPGLGRNFLQENEQETSPGLFRERFCDELSTHLPFTSLRGLRTDEAENPEPRFIVAFGIAQRTRDAD
jgi:hypothetical protein